MRRDGFRDDRIRLVRSIDARYRNQIHELTIPIPGDEHYGPEQLETILSTFHGEHESQFTYSLPDVPVEFLHWRLAAIAESPRVPRPAAAAADDPIAAGQAALTGEREAYFPEFGEKVATPVYTMSKLAPNATIRGQAIVESPNTTLVINPGDEVNVLDGGRLLVTVGAAG